ncbi:acyl-CoA synthetase (AMP-forming)/AMP-acid ligase II [Halopolyspora algeriensis]|uniref:Acyl-CoA synthetase (AMP-forming)/AMP-acid ligase II n=1 Tax=Halopolyspora algeriensis TaxID=1500506 RepID=A0A368VTZ5_9ACTN|nr:FadD3 family acyl-CoA ligase [Halopolyspora algeriensis]RCW44553.1 acyl-CoA synthetase (AMP-forming)/AMP-acid ligase II [Halopolyspora algeriensis]TQM55913.1 acyl-CoA synthetase (AMP-forming)/AMP-acid ligase II [Halopolyspora algeriensis]
MSTEHASTSVPTTVPAALIRATERFGDAEAVVDHSGRGEVRLDYRQLHRRVRGLARALLAEGIAPGDRIAVNAPNTHHWVVTALAVLHVGATLVPVNTRFTSHETLDVLRRSNARMLAVAGPFLGRDRLAELRTTGTGEEPGAGPIPGAPGVRSVLRIPVEGAELPTEPDVLDWSELDERGAGVPLQRVDERAAAVRPTDVSDILYTSGTTGRSKGAISAHRQVLGVADAWASCGELAAGDRYLVMNPFFHSFGYKAGILVCLLRGATLVPIPAFDVERIMHLVHRERITVLPGPPTLYQSLLDSPRRDEYDLSGLRLAVTGAATVPVALIERMQQELSFSTVLTAYGLTEAVVATMCRPDDDPVTVSTTCGRPTAGFELRIAGPDGESLPADEVGEILLRGPNTMLGYCDDPEATASALDSDGWLHTGDVGRIDQRGYLTITDRLKDMYICGGFNVYPAEVEQELARLDGVAESAVIGTPDDRLGEVGRVFVVLGPGHSLSEQDVLDFCRQRLANFKVPRHVEFRTELPRNPGGKVLKRMLH